MEKIYIKNYSYYFKSIDDYIDISNIDNLINNLDKDGNNLLMLYFSQNKKIFNSNDINIKKIEISQKDISFLLNNNKLNFNTKNNKNKFLWMLYLQSNENIILTNEQEKVLFNKSINNLFFSDYKNNNLLSYILKSNKTIFLANIFEYKYIHYFTDNLILKTDSHSFFDFNNLKLFNQILLNKIFITNNKEYLTEIIKYLLINISDTDKFTLFTYILSNNNNNNLQNINQIDFDFINKLSKIIFDSIKDFEKINFDNLNNPLHISLMNYYSNLSYKHSDFIHFVDKNYNNNFKESLINYSLEFNSNMFFLLMTIPSYIELLKFNMFLKSYIVSNGELIDFIQSIHKDLKIEEFNLKEEDYKFLVNNLSYISNIEDKKLFLLNLLYKKSLSSQNNDFLINLFEKSFLYLDNPEDSCQYILPYIIDYSVKEKDFFIANNNLIEKLIIKFINISYALSSKQKQYLSKSLNFIFEEVLILNETIFKHVDNNNKNVLYYFLKLLKEKNIEINMFDKELLKKIYVLNKINLDKVNNKLLTNYIHNNLLLKLKHYFVNKISNKEKEEKKHNKNIKSNIVMTNNLIKINTLINIKENMFHKNEEIYTLIIKIINKLNFLNNNDNINFISKSKKEEIQYLIDNLYLIEKDYNKIKLSPVKNIELEKQALNIILNNLLKLKDLLEKEIHLINEKNLLNIKINNEKLK